MRINPKNVKKLAAFVLTAVLVTATTEISVARLHAQAASASIQGTVTDSSGAAIPDASVQVKSVNTGATQTVTSNAQGRFVASDLGVGDYELQAAKPGFQTVVRKGVTLTVGTQSVVDFSLPVGQQQQTVTVEGQASQVETTNSSVGTLTDQRQMNELPLNGRGFEQLIQLTAGVNVVNGAAPGGGGGFMLFGMQGRAPEYSIAGSRPEGQQILIDDESLQNFDNKGMSSVLGTSLGVEAIGEFQTLTNTYSAQFGGNGGVINAVSKSGTNAFHGSAYEFLRNDALDARQFIDPATIPEFRQNQFGGSIGGPIKKDKTFFFVNYEGIQLVQGETRIGAVPGCNLPQFAANCVITAANPATAQALANTLAVYPNATTVVNGQPEVAETANRNAHENYILGRFDYNISEKDSLFVRYISDKSQYTEPFGGGGFGGTTAVPYWPEIDLEHEQFATIEWRRLISPTLVNVARASFSRPGEYEYTGQTKAPGLVNGQDPLQFFGAGNGRQDGSLTITGYTTLGGAFQLPFNTTPNRFTEGDDIIWTHGAHNIRMGASVVRVDTNTFMPFFDGSSWSFTSLSNFVKGTVASVLYVPLGDYANRDYREINFTPYIQDDWKVSSKLTLNMGLRWEFVTNGVDAHNDLYEVPNVATAVAPYYTHVSNVMASNPNVRNFDPRFGFAYDPFADHKTSIRGGFGIFHEPTQPSIYTAGYWACYPWGLSVLVGALGATYPNIPKPGGLNLAAPSCSPGWDYDAESTPYNMQYNLNIQRELMRGTVLTVGFIGSRGLHGFTEQENNPPLACTYAEGPHCSNPSYANGFLGGYFGYGTPGAVTANGYLNPGLGSFPNVTPEATSRYNSMLISLTRRFTRNVQFSASYNLSNCISDGGWLGSFNSNGQSEFMNPYNLTLDKAPCSWNQSQVFKATGLVALPFRGNRFVQGWQLSGIVTANSGLPLTITDGYDEATGGSNYALPTRPDYVSGCQVYVKQVTEWYNPQCFTISAPGTFGDLGSDTLIGPRFVDFDFAVLKDTTLRENLRLQFRAEFFNILNHTNLALPNASLFVGGGSDPGGVLANYGNGGASGRSALAGQITNMFGTPRVIQFAMKLVF
jgi:hypothetical protein